MIAESIILRDNGTSWMDIMYFRYIPIRLYEKESVQKGFDEMIERDMIRITFTVQVHNK